MKALIFDNDPHFLQDLQTMLVLECPDWIANVETYTLPGQACEAVQLKAPDLVFLNADLSLSNECAVLKVLSPLHTKVIFIAATYEHAARAFRYYAAGFLLKPICPDELKSSVAYCYEWMRVRRKLDKLESLGLRPHHDGNGKTAFTLHTDDGINYLKVNEIVRLEASGGYSRFFMEDGESVMVSKGLKDWEEFFKDYRFFRVHDSHLVNLHFVKKYLRKEGGFLILKDGTRIPVARRRKDDLLDNLSDSLENLPVVG